MKRWMWLVPCAALIGLGGLALYMAGFREIVWYGLFLVCPLLHLAMMGSHGTHGSAGTENPPAAHRHGRESMNR